MMPNGRLGTRWSGSSSPTRRWYMSDAPTAVARPAPPARVPFEVLVKAASEEPARYPELDRALLEGVGGAVLPMCFDLTNTDEWGRLDPATRAAVAQAATAYLATF